MNYRDYIYILRSLRGWTTNIETNEPPYSIILHAGSLPVCYISFLYIVTVPTGLDHFMVPQSFALIHYFQHLLMYEDG